MSCLEIVYNFEMQSGEKIVYPIFIEEKTGSLILEGQEISPEWTVLENC